MKTIFDIQKWDDPELVAKWFKSRLDWDNPLTPQYSGTGKSQSVNWAGGEEYDFCKYRDGRWYEINIFKGDHIELVSIPADEDVFSTMLVGNFLINTGRLTIDVEFSCNPNVCEAIWFLSQARYEKGAETILPEYDILETNTPGYIGKMSESKILSYEPFKAINVDKNELSPFKGKRVSVNIDIGRNVIRYYYTIPIKDGRNMVETIECTERMTRPVGVPIYPIIWNIVPNHLQPPTKTVVMKVFRIKFEC